MLNPHPIFLSFYFLRWDLKIKSIISLVILFFFLSLQLHAQIPPIQWEKNFGGTGIERGHDMLPTTDGGFILAGLASSTNGDVSGNHGNNDAWIVKVNAVGDILWSKCFGGTAAEAAYAVKQTSDGGYIFIGNTNTTANNGDVSGHHGSASPLGTSDIWVVKLNASGDLQWQRCVGGRGNDTGYDILETTEGHFIAVGQTSSTDGDITPPTNGGTEGFVAKLNESGDLLWIKTYGGSGYDLFNAITPTIDGNYIVVGETRSSAMTDYLGGTSDAWVVKVDGEGNILWQKLYGGTGTDIFYSVIATNDGGYLFTGNTTSTDLDGFHPGAAGDLTDVYVVKADASGNIVWYKCIGGSSYDDGYYAIQTLDGGYMIGGETNSNDGDISNTTGTFRTGLVLKLDSGGSLEDMVVHGNVAWHAFQAIVQISPDSYMLVGRGSGQNDDLWLVKLDPTPLPVSFGSISATITNNQLTVDWEALAEINNDHYEVEVSIDGKTFKSIGVVKSKAPNGNSDTPLYYSLSAGTGVAVSILLPLAIMGISLSGGACRRFKGMMILVVVSMVVLTIGCAKKDIPLQKNGSSVFVRIKQVDKDGSFNYSKVVVAIIK